MNELAAVDSHDQNVKTIIVENAVDAITFSIPKCLKVFKSPPEIIPIREETLKTFLTDSYLRMDVPFLATFDHLAFIVLVEHEHDPYAFSIHRLVRYISHLEEEYHRPVVPIVYFPMASMETVRKNRTMECKFVGKRYYYFTYEAVCLKDYQARKYLNSPNLIARLMLPFMKFSSEEKLAVWDSAIMGILKLVDATDRLRQSKYLDFVAHYFKLSKADWEAYNKYKGNKIETEVIQMIGFKDDVLREGQQQGKVQEGKEILLTLFPRKLGPVPPEIEKRIRSLEDLDKIHNIVVRFLEINDWHELRQALN